MTTVTSVTLAILILLVVGFAAVILWVGFSSSDPCAGSGGGKKARVPGKSYCCSRCYPETGNFECVQPLLSDGTPDLTNQMICSTVSGVCEPKNNPGSCPIPDQRATTDWTGICPPGTLGL